MKSIQWRALSVLIAICGVPAVAQALQSGDAGFGKQWVRQQPLSIQADSLYPATWDINEYFGAGMTLLNKDSGYDHTINRPPRYANAPWQAFLPVPGTNSQAGIDEFNALRTIPGNIGWIVGDEPTTLRMPAHGAVADYIRQTDPSQIVYVTASNMVGTAAQFYGDASRPNYTYNDYLNDMVSIIKPDVLAYDLYPFNTDGTTHPQYLKNLMAVRTTALASGIPYWGWQQSFGTSLGTSTSRRPSESDNRFNVYTHLTAGYTGLLYWTYDYYGGTGNGLIDINGTPTALYHAAAQSNAETSRLGQSLRFLQSVDVRFVPGRNSPLNQENQTPQGLIAWGRGDGNDPHIVSVSVDFSDPANKGVGKDGLIGFFTDDAGQQYFMLTNLNHGENLSATAATLGFKISFDSTIDSLLRLNRVTGEQELVALTNHQLIWDLPGGTGDLFKYNTGNFVPEPATGSFVLAGAFLAALRRYRPRCSDCG